MAQRVYATESDYLEFIGSAGAPDRVNSLLRRASSEVDGLIRTAVYATDEDGYPTDARVGDALRDATCAFVAYWDETDDPTGAGAIAGPVKIGSVSLGGTSTGGASSRTPADTRRSDEALTILRNAGLITTATAHS